VIARTAIVAAGLALAACGGALSPLRNHAQVGRDAYAVFVGDGPGGRPDLFGVRAEGGPVFQLTYTSVAESDPALSPDGRLLAFLRARSLHDSLPGAVWVMNLLTGAERRLALPKGSPPPARVGWSSDGSALYVRAGAEIWKLGAPPAAPEPRRATAAESFAADTSLGVFLGDPPCARVVVCEGSLCAQSNTGPAVAFAQGGRDPLRWGADSVAFLSADKLVVRPVGPGHGRLVDWTGVPRAPRELTFFGGAAR
jgi:hypothetical protein